MTIGKPHPFKSSNGVSCRRCGRQLTQDEKLSVLRWIARRLDAHDFDGVVVVDATSSTLLIASTDTNSTRPPESDEAQLILIGIVAEEEQFEALRTEIIAAISDAKFYVVESQGVIQDGLDICERLQYNRALTCVPTPAVNQTGREAARRYDTIERVAGRGGDRCRRAVAAKSGTGQARWHTLRSRPSPSAGCMHGTRSSHARFRRAARGLRPGLDPRGAGGWHGQYDGD